MCFHSSILSRKETEANSTNATIRRLSAEIQDAQQLKSKLIRVCIDTIFLDLTTIALPFHYPLSQPFLWCISCTTASGYNPLFLGKDCRCWENRMAVPCWPQAFILISFFSSFVQVSSLTCIEWFSRVSNCNFMEVKSFFTWHSSKVWILKNNDWKKFEQETLYFHDICWIEIPSVLLDLQISFFMLKYFPTRIGSSQNIASLSSLHHQRCRLNEPAHRFDFR